MLTSVFAVTYTRLIRGGLGSGVARDQLPSHLREAHDYIITIRNERFAHNDGHASTSADVSIDFDGTKFNARINYTFGFHIGGAREWEELVVFLDGLCMTAYAQLARLKEKTGYEWTFPEGAQPPWVEQS